jgi:hypothetical protein
MTTWGMKTDMVRLKGPAAIWDTSAVRSGLNKFQVSAAG